VSVAPRVCRVVVTPPDRVLPGTWIKKLAKSVVDLAPPPRDILKGKSPAHAVENS
jgi:hypothetical protein